MDTQFAANIIAIVAACISAIAAIATVVVIFLNRQQVKVSQKQVKISQEQIYDQYQPVLFPFHITQREINEMNLRDQGRISAKYGIKNVGPGVALNIRGVIFEPKTSDLNDKKKYGQNFLFSAPLAPGDSLVMVGRPQGLRMSGDWQIGRFHQYSLYAPTYNLEEIEEGKQPVLHRLALTYHDVFGRKHASIFDLTHLDAWECVEIIPDIPVDLDDLLKLNKLR